jgi:hypothetical protein
MFEIRLIAGRRRSARLENHFTAMAGKSAPVSAIIPIEIFPTA